MTVNGTVLHYQDRGSGPPLVLVHGSMADYRNWRQQKLPFAQHHRVITYSRRYHFPNAFHGSGLDYSLNLHAADLAALIENRMDEPSAWWVLPMARTPCW